VAATATERKLFLDGEWVETGAWQEVRSPYSGEIVARVAQAGAAEARQAIDAAERAMQEPLPAHKRAEILVRVAGYVASADGFTDHPKVINGASQLLIDVFGESGRHARIAIGVAELPAGVPVEVEFMFEVSG